MDVCLFCYGINLWFLFLFIGIYVIDVVVDYCYVWVELCMCLWNCNYVGIYFGGSLFVMIDLFWMFMVMQNLGCDYYVWDCVGEIEFFKFGCGMVMVEFCFDEVLLVQLCVVMVGGEKYLYWFSNDIFDVQGEVVVCVCKQVYLCFKFDVCGVGKVVF